MKILLATTAATLNGGGIGSYNVEFCNAFKETSELHLLTREPYKELDGYKHVFSLGINPLKRYQDYKSLIYRINNEKYDVIFNSDSSELAIIAPFLTAPIVTVSHTFNNLPAIRAGYNNEYLSSIIALSKAGKVYIENKFGITNKDKVTYLYNFVHHKKVNNTLEKEQHKVLNIIFPGGAIPMKYPEMVVGAANMLANTNLDFNFYWYGNDVVPLQRLSIPKRVADLVVKDNRIHIQGNVSREKSRQIIDSANIFILPSRAEGCPVSLMEAMCTGCIPIVGDGMHVCREILEDGGFGLIVKKGSSKSLYEAIVKIITNPENYKDSYKKSLNYSNEKLSERQWKINMVKIFEDASKKKKKTIPLTKVSLFKSKFSFDCLAHQKILEDRLLSLKVFIKFNLLFIKYKINGTI